MHLTEGAVLCFQNGGKMEKPILKITNMRRIVTENAPDKIRLNLTDGQLSHSYVMLTTQLNDRVNSGEIAQDKVIQLDNYVVKTQNNKNIVMIIELTVVSDTENLPRPIILDNKPKQPITKPLNAVANNKVTNNTVANNIVTIPISLLNPYQNKWTIKGRVLQKDRIKSWSKPNSEGKLFTFTIADEECDIRITAFNAEVDRFFEMINVDKTYLISKGTVKAANRQFNTTKCEHEITIKSETEISEVVGELEIPAMKYNFVDIADIKDHSPNSAIDIVAVGHEIKESSIIIVKATNKEIPKRDVVLVDRSGCSINLTLWGDDVKSVDNLVHPIMVMRGALVKDFGGRSLSVGNGTLLRINPQDVAEAAPLLGWYESEGRNSHFNAQSVGAGGFKPTKKATINQLSCTSDGDKGEYFTVQALIAAVKKENVVYKGCMTCNKKLVDLNNNMFNCEKCNIESPNYKYRMMLNLNIIDYTGAVWVTVFQDAGEKLLGVSADIIGQLTEEERKDDLNKILDRVVYTVDIAFKLRVTNDTYNDETRKRVTVQDCQPNSIAEEMAAH